MVRSNACFAAATAIALWLAGPVSARAADTLAYDVAIQSGNDDLNGRFTDISRLVQAKDKPPPGLAGLEQRADTDKDRFRSVLRSQGYYDGMVEIAIDDSKSPAQVTVKVTPGPRYMLGACAIHYVSPPPQKAPESCKDIGLGPGRAAEADPIIKATETLLRKLQSHGRPDAQVTERIAVVDHLTHKMRLTFDTDPGREAHFGTVEVKGAAHTEHDFLARIVPWQPGARYDVRKLDAYRQRLADLNLFDTLVVKPDTARETQAGAAPIEVEVHERPPHSVGLGVEYATDIGPGGMASWENRNLWGRAEDLKLSVTAGTLGQSLEVSLTLPHQPETGQTLGFDVTTEHDTTDAYDKNGLTGLAQITAPLGGHWTGKGGVAFETAAVDQAGNSVFNILGSLPVGVTYDSTKSLLDPTDGERLSIQAQPVFGTSGGVRNFLILETDASAYRPLMGNKKLVAAVRLKLGTVLFEPEFAVPPDFRFYAGGGGSVRGYAYQHVSPRDAAGNLIGGRSIGETSLELRYRAWQDIGIVGFVDAGTVAESATFADAPAPRVGAGLGVRYYTSFGPLRLDLGVPLNPQPNDAAFQVYISLGQAF